MKRPHFSILTLILLALAFPTLLARAQAPDRFLATLDVRSAAGRTALISQGFTVWDADLDSITLLVDRSQLRRLEQKKVGTIDLHPLDFPPSFDAYHDYAEMVSELQALHEQHSQVTQLQSIGKSIEGRELWALRITDHPDEQEPDENAILIFAGAHAREHLTVEQALFLAHDLLDNYGREGEVTNLVNHRDIWLIPNLNPDGSEWDINQWLNAPPYWRKNRRDNRDGTRGVDLNRNFGYQWGCCGGSSGFTAAETYRGPAPFSEPENQALRDFASAHPRLTMCLSLHTYSELVLYPYGYTYQDAPPDMKPGDLDIFRAVASGMAQRNGYQAAQASDLYIVDGSHDDWLYHELGIYALTWELYPASYSPGFYPPASAITSQTARNRTALRYTIALADDPAKSVGLGADMTPPQIQLLSPQAGAQIVAGAPIIASVAVTDDVGVATVEYLLDDAPVAVVTAPPFTTTLRLTEGEHRLQARAFDAAHGQTLSDSIAINVVAAPTIAVYLPLLLTLP